MVGEVAVEREWYRSSGRFGDELGSGSEVGRWKARSRYRVKSSLSDSAETSISSMPGM